MWNTSSATGSKSLLNTISKDGKVMINNWDAAYKLLNDGAEPLSKNYPKFRDKLDLFFVDYEWVPLLV